MTAQTSDVATEPVSDSEALKRAIAFARDGDYESAIRCLKKSLDAKPEQEIAAGLLGSIYAELGMVERAAEYFERVLGINSENALARFQLGLLHFGAGRKREALDTWSPSLSDPGEFVAHYYSGAALLQLEESDKARSLLQIAAQRMPPGHVLYPRLKELLRHLNS